VIFEPSYLEKFSSKYGKLYHFPSQFFKLSPVVPSIFVFEQLEKCRCFAILYKGFDRENIEIGQKLVEDVIFSPGNIDFRISRSILHKKKFIIQTLPKKRTEFDQ